MKTEKTLEGRCKSCGETTIFKFQGNQKNPANGEFSLYTCNSCNTTLIEQSIIKRCKMWYMAGDHCTQQECDGYRQMFCYTPEGYEAK